MIGPANIGQDVHYSCELVKERSCDTSLPAYLEQSFCAMALQGMKNLHAGCPSQREPIILDWQRGAEGVSILATLARSRALGCVGNVAGRGSDATDSCPHPKARSPKWVLGTQGLEPGF